MKFLLAVTVFFLSCTGKKSNAISEKKMVLLLRDMAETEIYVNTYLAKDSTINKSDAIKRYCDTIFAIHKVTKVEFENSLGVYIKQPDKFKQILDSAQTDARKVSYFSEKMTHSVQ